MNMFYSLAVLAGLVVTTPVTHASGICGTMMTAIFGRVSLLPQIEWNGGLAAKVSAIETQNLAGRAKVMAIWSSYREERLKILPPEIRKYAEQIETISLDASQMHFADAEEMDGVIPSPQAVLEFRQKVAEYDEITQGKITIDAGLDSNMVAYALSSAGQLEIKIQLAHNPMDLMMMISDFFNPLPAGVNVMRQIRMRGYSAEWRVLRLLGQDLVNEQLTRLRGKTYSNKSLDRARKELIEKAEAIFALSEEEYQTKRWRGQERIFQWLAGYVGPKIITTVLTFFVIFH